MITKNALLGLFSVLGASALTALSGPGQAAVAADEAPKLDGLIAWAGDETINVSEPSGRGWTKLVDMRIEGDSLSWSPDGRRLLWASRADGDADLYTLAANGSDLVKVTRNGRWDVDPVWSPDGARIAWSGGSNIWVAEANGANAIRVSSGPYDDRHPTWSPDGTRVAWKRGTGTVCIDGVCEPPNPGIYVADADGSSLAKVPGTALDTGSPVWSPAGDRLAWQARRDGVRTVVVADSAGVVQRVFDGDYVAPSPGWSPDGTKVTWTTEIGTAHLGDLATGSVRALDFRGPASDVAWAPSGTALAAGHDADYWSHRAALESISSAEGSTGRVFEAPLHKAYSVDWQPVEHIHVCGGRQATLIGTAGDDVLNGGEGDDVVASLDGDDVVSVHAGRDVVCSGAGNDEVRTGSSWASHGLWGNLVFAGHGADVVYGGGQQDLVFGGGGADRLFGGGGSDILRGGFGNDRLLGGLGPDRLQGEGHADVLFGGAGRDTLFGGDGPDYLNGGGDHDYLYGGLAGDVLYGWGGQDTMFGNAGPDRLHGGADIDWMYAGPGNDWLWGGGHDDRMYGGRHYDRCDGQGGVNHAAGCEASVRTYPFP